MHMMLYMMLQLHGWSTNFCRELQQSVSVKITPVANSDMSFTTQAVAEWQETDTNSITLVNVQPVRYKDRLLNFGKVLVDLSVTIDEREYVTKHMSIKLARYTNGTSLYIVDKALEVKNRREAYRVPAFYKACLHNGKSHGVADVKIYDMSVNGLGVLIDEESTLEVGTDVGVSIFISDSRTIKTEGKVVRRCKSKYPTKDIVGVELYEKGKTPAYTRFVIAEQVRQRNGRVDIE